MAVVAAYILDAELFWLHATEAEIAAATTDVWGLTQWHFAWSDILFLSCLVSGCWVGIRQSGRHLRSYFFLGTLTALVVAVVLTSYETTRFVDIGSGFGEIGLSFSGALVLPLLFDPDYIPVHTFGPLSAYVETIIVTTLFISGGLFGDLIERIRRPHEAKTGLPERIVKRLPKSLSGKGSAHAVRALPATLLLFTPLWEPVWGKVLEGAYTAITALYHQYF